MPKPEDARCRAMLEDGEQCDKDISYDEAGDFWSAFCKTHREEDNKARKSGEARVVRFDRQSVE